MVQKLIIGASGLLGRNIKLADSVFTPSHRDLDITNLDQLLFYFSNKIFSEVVVLAAYTNVAKANVDKSSCYSTNVIGIKNILSLLGDKKITYISTDYVFDGEKGQYEVNDPINPVSNNYYALTKGIGEQLVSTAKNHLIIRTSFCESNSWPYKAAFCDQFTSRDRVDIIAPMISKAIDNNLSGTIHIGTERKSVLDLAKSINPMVESISRKSITGVNLPYDTSLVLSNL